MKKTTEPIKSLVVVQPDEIDIPAKKLGFKQHQVYQDYGQKVIRDIEGMAKEIKDINENKFLKENQERIQKEINKENKKTITQLGQINKEIETIIEINDERIEQNDKFREQISKIESKQRIANDTKIQEIRDVNSELTATKTKFRATESTGINKDLMSCEIEIGMNKLTINKRNTELEKIYDYDYINGILKEEFKKQQRERFMLQEQIKDMKDSFSEVLLFNDQKIQPMFKQLMELKIKLKEEYRQLKLEQEKQVTID